MANGELSIGHQSQGIAGNRWARSRDNRRVGLRACRHLQSSTSSYVYRRLDEDLISRKPDGRRPSLSAALLSSTIRKTGDWDTLRTRQEATSGIIGGEEDRQQNQYFWPGQEGGIKRESWRKQQSWPQRRRATKSSLRIHLSRQERCRRRTSSWQSSWWITLKGCAKAGIGQGTVDMRMTILMKYKPPMDRIMPKIHTPANNSQRRRQQQPSANSRRDHTLPRQSSTRIAFPMDRSAGEYL